MPRIRNFNDIVLSCLEYLRKAQPLLDTKPGISVRDVTIDSPAIQFARLYEELNTVSNSQSLSNVVGIDIDKLAQNIGAVRSRGSKSTVSALLTFSSIAANIALNKGDTLLAKNGTTFALLNSLTLLPSQASTYKSIAAKYQSDLEFLGITDQYAIEVTAECISTGTSGNIPKYSIYKASIPEITNATNISPATGGSAVETDASFKNKYLSIFNGSNVGTALGYQATAIGNPAVIDCYVVEAGDPLMTRDGTQLTTNGTILSEGSGGKTDVIILGTNIQETTDSYIYKDLSNKNDATDASNDKVLGQIAADAGKTVTRKRIDDLKTGVLPSQPVYNIIEVIGSLSGRNFKEKTIDEWGRVSGNYELLKDTGAFAGSPWGFDKLHWISDTISDLAEDRTKLQYNGQDSLAYSDVSEITGIQQYISVTNENSSVLPSNRSYIQLAHYPVTSVTRVFNSTTGERYVVSGTNPDGTGAINETGRIVITGQSLPAVSDILQVDYTWIFSYDSYIDFDNKLTNQNIRSSGDTIDWGYSNEVRRERVILATSGSYVTATSSHPISSVESVNAFTEEAVTISLSSSRLAVVVSDQVSNVVSIIRNSDGAQLWNTTSNDGSISSFIIYLPTDTTASFGNAVTVTYNAVDVYNTTTPGNFNQNVISITPSSTATVGTLVECNYVANISNLLPATLLSSLPAIRNLNKFNTNILNNIGTQPTTHLYSGVSIVQNYRIAPTNLALSITGTISPGIITITGTTSFKVENVVFTAAYNSLKQNLSSAIRSYLGLSSVSSIPSNIKISKIAKVEKVSVSDDLKVLEVLNTYDLIGYSILDNSFVKSESISDSTLSATEFELPPTTANKANTPEIGERFRITFYIVKTNDSENVSFSKSGTLYTQKKFALADIIAISSGFISTQSASATLSIAAMNQPATKNRYRAFYDYLAPKINERITIRYNYDKLISDVTKSIEPKRTTGADVLVKAAMQILVDATLYIVISSDMINSSAIVLQNVQNAITSMLNAKALGTTIDQSDLINSAYSVNGVDRVRVMYFNKEGETGSVLSIVAQNNEYIVANDVLIYQETR